MDESVGKSRPAAAAMQDVLQAEVMARQAVEAARAEAAQRVEAAHRRAGSIETAARKRVGKVISSSRNASDALLHSAQRERERRLAHLETGWQVNIGTESLRQAVREFALALINGSRNGGQTGS